MKKRDYKQEILEIKNSMVGEIRDLVKENGTIEGDGNEGLSDLSLNSELSDHLVNVRVDFISVDHNGNVELQTFDLDTEMEDLVFLDTLAVEDIMKIHSAIM